MEAQPPERPGEAAALRVSDADRHAVAEVLREAAGEGRLDLEELDDRLERAYRARTYADLVPLTADLPVAGVRPVTPPPLPAPAAPGPRYTSSIAVMSQVQRHGPWVLEGTHTAVALMGQVVIDLRDAALVGEEVVLNASAVMGEISILVRDDAVVQVEGAGIMGEFGEHREHRERRRSRRQDVAAVQRRGPTVRLRGVALMGSVTVRRPGPTDEGSRELER